MIVGFVIWSAVFLVLLGIGILTWRSDRAAAFFSGTKPPKVSDVRKYNHTVGTLWFVYAVLFELLGIPLLLLKQKVSGLLWAVLGVAAISIGLVIVYSRILRRFEQKPEENGREF